MLRVEVKKHISRPKDAPRESLYAYTMSKKRTPPARTLMVNLNKLMETTGWSNRHLAGLSGVSDRYIGMIRRGEYKATVDIADQLAKPFGLVGWQLIVPDIDLALARTGRLAKLLENYQRSPEHARHYIDGVAEHDAKTSNGNGGS